jgi:phosphopentomutase
VPRACVIVLDAVGAGELPDAEEYGDVGSNTLGNVARAVGGLDLPNLEALGLGNIMPLDGCPPQPGAPAVAGRLVERSKGKDTTTGHWEHMGIVTPTAFPTYPHGFPDEIIDPFMNQTGRGVLGNKPASGTEIIQELGEEHQRTGKWIVYTSADSVFQVAAHEQTVPLPELYQACVVAREMLIGEHAVSRVIARPFQGTAGDYRRTPNRKDFSIAPTGTTLLDIMADAGVVRIGIGKVDDLFAGRNISSEHTPTNADAYRGIEQALDTLDTGFVFVNVIEFDQTWGHRNDVPGFHQGLKELDAWIPRLLARLQPDDLVMLTADHGNDPTTPSTDHAREVVPVLVLGPNVHPVPLGTRRTFADMGQTVGEYFGLPALGAGTSFLKDVSV